MLRMREKEGNVVQIRLYSVLLDHRKGRFQSNDTHATKKTSKSELTGFDSRALFHLGFQCGRAEGTAGVQVIHFLVREKSSRQVGLGFILVGVFSSCFEPLT